MAIEKLGALAIAALAVAPTQKISNPRANCIQISEIREVAESMYAASCRKTTVTKGVSMVVPVKSRECDSLGKLVAQSVRAEKKYCRKSEQAKN
ncbi:MAG: hypothetical protein RLZZ283_672 [Candidatus Parcubacteria bacterium]|jgi:hypothetical protein